MYKVRFHYIGDFAACQWVGMRFSVMLRVYDNRLVDLHKFLLQSDGGGKGKPRLNLRRGANRQIILVALFFLSFSAILIFIKTAMCLLDFL